MAFIEWDPSFSVGSAILDADHRKLIKILNEIHDAWASGQDNIELGRLFDELMEYTETHFHREESRLADHDYPDLAAHHESHERLREMVIAFRSRHLVGQHPGKMTEEVTTFLKTWLMKHILEDDMRYKPLFAK